MNNDINTYINYSFIGFNITIHNMIDIHVVLLVYIRKHHCVNRIDIFCFIIELAISVCNISAANKY